MFNRPIATVFGLLLIGATPAPAQDMGPLVRGKQFATIQQFDSAVLDWFVTKYKGRLAVSLPADGDTTRTANLRTAAGARGIAVTAHAAGKCPTPRGSCMRDIDVLLNIFPPQTIDSVKFTMSYGRWQDLGDRVAAASIRAWLARTPGGFVIEGVIIGVN